MNSCATSCARTSNPPIQASAQCRTPLPTIPLGHYRKYLFRAAKVINNSVNFQNNYFTIHRGEKQGIRKDMGVISPSGVAGTVIFTSENMAVVMSLLHSQSRQSAS